LTQTEENDRLDKMSEVNGVHLFLPIAAKGFLYLLVIQQFKLFTGITTTRLRTFRLRHFVYRHLDISSTDISSTVTFLVEIEAGVMKRILYQ